MSEHDRYGPSQFRTANELVTESTDREYCASCDRRTPHSSKPHGEGVYCIVCNRGLEGEPTTAHQILWASPEQEPVFVCSGHFRDLERVDGISRIPPDPVDAHLVGEARIRLFRQSPPCAVCGESDLVVDLLDARLPGGEDAD